MTDADAKAPSAAPASRTPANTSPDAGAVLRLLLATGNAKKGKELTALVGDAATVLTLGDVGLFGLEVAETGSTFADNAALKVEGVAAALAGRVAEGAVAPVDVVIADDSGLAVDALDGRPGVRSARFAADAGCAFLGADTDSANNRLLLTLLGAVPDERRTARFICALDALHVPSGRRVVAEGTVQGFIARELRGAGGFGYDPLFIVADAKVPLPLQGRRMAELSSGQKGSISHRGRALEQLRAAGLLTMR
jgi:XTP/dITP diphosphohydrolase